MPPTADDTTVALHVDARLRPLVARQRERIDTGDPGSERLVTTVQGRVLHDLQVRAEVEGHGFLSDEPVAKGGHDAGPAPLRYFLGGILMCLQVWVVKGATFRRVPLRAVEGEIRAYLAGGRADDGSRPFSRLDCTLDVAADTPSAVVDEIVHEAALGCPAMATVSRGTRVDLRVRHNGRDLG